LAKQKKKEAETTTTPAIAIEEVVPLERKKSLKTKAKKTSDELLLVTNVLIHFFSFVHLLFNHHFFIYLFF